MGNECGQIDLSQLRLPPVPPLVEPPSHLPDAKNLLTFDVDGKKNEIFDAARERIKSKAQYTRSHRKPWTQITVTLPIKPVTKDEEDLAVVWAVMRRSTNDKVKETEKGDVTWTLWGDDYLKWLNIDPEKTKPVNMFVHPVLYETGEIFTDMVSFYYHKVYLSKISEIRCKKADNT